MKVLKPIVKTADVLTTAGLMFGKTLEMKDQNDCGDKSECAVIADANNVMPIPTHELLDRFELLYPTNTDLADLRRAYIDHDLSSIFRLVGFSTVRGNADDLRRAVLEQNLHSIFRLVDNEDLRKLLLENNTWKLWPLLSLYQHTQFVPALKNFYVNNTPIDSDCFSRGQLRSKQWAVNELSRLKLKLGTVFLCAGWYGILATMLFESELQVTAIRSFDIDPTCVDIAEVFNKPWFVNNWRFKSITDNVLNINYSEHTWSAWSNKNDRMSYPITDQPDTIINTSCEHIENFKDWYDLIPQGKLLVLQANDFSEVEEHLNCYENLAAFTSATPMSTVLYQGTLELEKYTRFMRIGIK